MIMIMIIKLKPIIRQNVNTNWTFWFNGSVFQLFLCE